MNVRSLVSLLRQPHLRGRMQLNQDLIPFVRLHYFFAATQCGLLQLLETPHSREEIIQRLGIQRVELLDPFLDLGLTLSELARTEGVFQLTGARSRAPADPVSDPWWQ